MVDVHRQTLHPAAPYAGMTQTGVPQARNYNDLVGNPAYSASLTLKSFWQQWQPMRVSLPRLRCLEDEPSTLSTMDNAPRRHVFVFTPPPYGPQVIGLQFPTFTPKGYTITAAAIVNPDYPLADCVLERGERLIVTADNMALLRFIEDSGMFRRVG